MSSSTTGDCIRLVNVDSSIRITKYLIVAARTKINGSSINHAAALNVYTIEASGTNNELNASNSHNRVVLDC